MFSAFADLNISRLGIGIKKHSWNRLNLGKLESWSPSQLYTWTVKYMAHMLVWNSIQTLIEETHIWLLSFSRCGGLHIRKTNNLSRTDIKSYIYKDDIRLFKFKIFNRFSINIIHSFSWNVFYRKHSHTVVKIRNIWYSVNDLIK